VAAVLGVAQGLIWSSLSPGTIYKVYVDGVVNLDLGGSAAQSVILMVFVIAVTAVQFRFVERRVHY